MHGETLKNVKLAFGPHNSPFRVQLQERLILLKKNTTMNYI